MFRSSKKAPLASFEGPKAEKRQLKFMFTDATELNDFSHV